MLLVRRRRDGARQCLLWDNWPQSGAYHDTDPFGTYRTEKNGSVVFEQSRIVCPRYVPCKTAQDVDKLVASVLLKAAKHANRYLVLTERMLKGVRWRIQDGKTWSGRDVDLDGARLSGALPSDIVVHVGAPPEEFGRLCYDCDSFGVSISNVHALGVFRIAPETTLERQPITV